MSDRPGCLFGLPARLLGLHRGRKALAAPVRPLPHPTEHTAVQRGRQAAERCIASLHADDTLSPMVLDEVTTAVQALAETVEALAARLAEARTWLAQHNVEGLRQELVALELEPGETWSAQQATQAQAETVKRTLAHVDDVEWGLPTLRARLDATVRALEQLVAETTRGRVSGQDGAAGLLGRSRAQIEETERALQAWRATVEELDGLG